jgi:hypothetical protein
MNYRSEVNKIVVFKYSDNETQNLNYGYCGIDKLNYNSNNFILISFINNKFYAREISSQFRKSDNRFYKDNISTSLKIINMINNIDI